jgi:hypothetical protein
MSLLAFFLLNLVIIYNKLECYITLGLKGLLVTNLLNGPKVKRK